MITSIYAEGTTTAIRTHKQHALERHVPNWLLHMTEWQQHKTE